MKYGFVYIWRDKKHKRYYVGARYGNVNDGYICSSTWMRNAYNRRPQDFKRRILKININNKLDTFKEEYKWLCLIKQNELGRRYYNLRVFNYNESSDVVFISDKSKEKMSVSKKQMSKETKEKIRQANLGKKGRKNTEETKEKMRLSAIKRGKNSSGNTGKKMSKELKEKLIKINTGKPSNKKGIPLSEETKEKIRKARAKQVITEETKQKMSLAQKERHKLKRIENNQCF